MEKELQKQEMDQAAKSETVSPAVIKRLPRYFRYLRELIREGTLRISSGELAARMHVTASQIRQDLNCFGGFGQQGYGYNVQYLYTKISELLGVGEGFSAVIVGTGNLGRALIRNSMFEKRGVDVIAAFDVDPQQIGRVIADVNVLPMSELEDFCRKHKVDIAVLTLPKESAAEVARMLAGAGVRAFWNFTSTELQDLEPACTVETVHLGDSLMTLCYRLRSNGEDV